MTRAIALLDTLRHSGYQEAGPREAVPLQVSNNFLGRLRRLLTGQVESPDTRNPERSKSHVKSSCSSDAEEFLACGVRRARALPRALNLTFKVQGERRGLASAVLDIDSAAACGRSLGLHRPQRSHSQRSQRSRLRRQVPQTLHRKPEP